MENREIYRASRRIWAYVRDNCMSLDSMGCTDRIFDMMKSLVKRANEETREAKRSAASARRETLSHKRAADALRAEIIANGKSGESSPRKPRGGKKKGVLKRRVRKKAEPAL